MLTIAWVEINKDAGMPLYEHVRAAFKFLIHREETSKDKHIIIWLLNNNKMVDISVVNIKSTQSTYLPTLFCT